MPYSASPFLFGVSTHSRAEAAALGNGNSYRGQINVSTHSRAEAAAITSAVIAKAGKVSTHSRAEAAAEVGACQYSRNLVSTHSRAEAAAHFPIHFQTSHLQFQHTAARRRLR